MMKEAGAVLMSSNGIAIAVILLLAIILLLLLSRLGYFSFKVKGLAIGHTENEVRAILLKQKEFLLQYCSCLTQSIISDLQKKNVVISYINTDYVVEKVVDELEKVKTINIDVGFGTIYKTIRKDTVIEIVKQGGVRNEVAEYV